MEDKYNKNGNVENWCHVEDAVIGPEVAVIGPPEDAVTSRCCGGIKQKSKTKKKLQLGSNKNQTPKTAEIGTFGDRKCDSPPALVDYMLDEAKRHFPKPNFIIWTGDTPAHRKYTQEEFINTMITVTHAIKQRFPDVLVIPVLGNHDMEPSNSFPDDTEQLGMYRHIYYLWKGWIGDEPEETFLRGGYYYFKSPLDGSEYLVLNTNIYYVINTAIENFTNPEDPTGQFEFIEKHLAKIKSKNGKINIVGHVPPGGFVFNDGNPECRDEMPKQYNKRLTDLFTKYADSIGFMLFGHLHTDTFRILKDSNGMPVQRMFLNPAITPVFNLNNPAFRVFDYDRKNFNIKDIRTFYVNLDELNQKGPNQVKTVLEYSMSDVYGLKSFDAIEMNNLAKRFATDDTLFNLYVRYRGVMNENDNLYIDRF
uniref:Sphingomyelin phosphodiesterase n=1 Tax=Meloidogyne incognita TaxID=6306 RepID=A0A914KT34_MELIC